MRNIALFIMLTTVLNACSWNARPSAQSLQRHGYAEISRWLDRQMPKRLARHDIAGLSIAVVDRNDIVLQKAYGRADESTDVTPDTLFRAGSITKSLTAVGVMQLVEQGRLDLDAPLRDAIVNFKIKHRGGGDDGVTLRRILSHHAGLPGDIVDGMWAERPAPIESVVRLLHQHTLSSQPGTTFAYSNIGYSLAGRAIELASGESYADYMRRHVLQPLAMQASGFDIGQTRGSAAGLAGGYIDGVPVREYDIRDKPAGALITTAADLARFARMIIAAGAIDNARERLLRADSVAQMLSAPSYPSPYSVDNPAALGWFSVAGDDAMVMHNGQTMSHSALLQINLTRGIGVVILANSPAQQAIQAIADEMLEMAATASSADAARPADVEPLQRAPLTSADLPGAPVSGAGCYVSEFGVIDVSGSHRSLGAIVDGQRWSLRGGADKGYRLRLKLFGLLPVANAELRAVRIHFRDVDGERLAYIEQHGRFGLIASACQAQTPPAAWLQRVGQYTLSSELPDAGPSLDFGPVELRDRNGTFVLTAAQGDSKLDYALRFVSDREAVVQGYGRNLGATVHILDDGQIEWLGLRYQPMQSGAGH